MKEEAIVLCSDKGLLDKIKTVISSIINGGEWEGDIVLITDTSDLITWELRKKGVIVVHIDPSKYETIFRFSDERKGEHPIGSLFRLLMLYFDTFKEWKQVMYLDMDTISVNKIDFPDVQLLGASPEYCGPDHIHSVYFCPNALPVEKYEYWNVRFESDLRDEYRIVSKHIFKYEMTEVKFNSGLLKFNPEAIGNRIKRRIIEISEAYSHMLVYPDQPILNLTFWNKWEDMGPDFGTQLWMEKKNGYRYLKQPIHHPYGMFYKPWDSNCYWFSKWLEFEALNPSLKIDHSPEIKRLESSFKKDLIRYSDDRIIKTIGEIEPIRDVEGPFKDLPLKELVK